MAEVYRATSQYVCEQLLADIANGTRPEVLQDPSHAAIRNRRLVASPEDRSTILSLLAGLAGMQRVKGQAPKLDRDRLWYAHADTLFALLTKNWDKEQRRSDLERLWLDALELLNSLWDEVEAKAEKVLQLMRDRDDFFRAAVRYQLRSHRFLERPRPLPRMLQAKLRPETSPIQQ